MTGGFFSGFLGIGGAVVLIPLMLEVPPLFGVGRLTMNEVAAVTMIQVLAASVTGYLTHRRSGFAHTGVILTIGVPMGCFALIGAVLSKFMAGRSILILFGGLVVLAFGMLLKRSADEHVRIPADFSFNAPLSVAVGSAVGMVSGIVGAGGGFILIPVMIRVLSIPLRIALGSSLGIVFIGALTGAVGKLVTLQVEWEYLLPIIAGSIPASILGARLSRRVPASYLRYALTVVVLVVLLRTWSNILWGGAPAP